MLIILIIVAQEPYKNHDLCLQQFSIPLIYLWSRVRIPFEGGDNWLYAWPTCTTLIINHLCQDGNKADIKGCHKENL